MKEIYLLFAGEDGTSGNFIGAFSSKENAQKVIQTYYTHLHAGHPFSDEKRNLLAGFANGRTEWARIDRHLVDQNVPG